MWVAKIRFSSKGTLIGSYAAKYGLSLFGFPLAYTKQDDGLVVQLAGTLFGAVGSKKKFVAALKRHPRVLHLASHNDFLLCILREPLHMARFYDPRIIHVEPGFISEKGYETVTLGSFERTFLTGILDMFEKQYEGKLLSLKHTKIGSISVMSIQPELTKKQRAAMDLAIKHGYYQSPRKIDLVTLAKMSGLSFSTFQVHLRKAEQKIIPYSFK